MSACPIALAAKEQLSKSHLTVSKVDVHWYDPAPPTTIQLTQVTARLPAEAQLFVRRFDNNLSVSPFSFDLEVPNSGAAVRPEGRPSIMEVAGGTY